MKNNELFRLVPASKLSRRDKFMKHIPKSREERKFKKEVKKVIKAKIQDFYRPILDPSYPSFLSLTADYRDDGEIFTGRDYNWWSKWAENYKPSQKSRLGTKSEYIAFLAVLIKDLVESGWKVADAWSAVCTDSKKLGNCWHYGYNYKFNMYKKTGKWKVGAWCDLGNTHKILAYDEEEGGFWVAGGKYHYNSVGNPLAGMSFCRDRNCNLDNCTGWLVWPAA